MVFKQRIGKIAWSYINRDDLYNKDFMSFYYISKCISSSL